ncbi:MAG: amino-acid N-acetyltransferase, partial [Sinobacterium sp.]|nr:amino-acid N-acetyltransferase [Sinobacterium sp.]
MTPDTSHNTASFIHAFRESSPYINMHRGKTMVLLLDGYCLQSEQLQQTVYDIALLHSLGIKIALVLGTRALIDQALTEAGIETQLHLNKRITTAEILEMAKRVSGRFRFELEALFSAALPNTPMQGSDIQMVSGNFITAKPLGVIEGKDYQFTGQVRKVDAAPIAQQLANNSIVLLSNIGFSVTGECFNVAAEDVATAVAHALDADKFIILSQQQQIDALPKEITLSQAVNIQTPSYNLSCLIKACERGIKRCHLVSFEQDGALLSELFTTDGSGIMLSQDSFEAIRIAENKDIGGIMQLLQPLEAAGQLVKRDRELLEQEIEHFIVIERDNKVIACSALYPSNETIAEVACVATDNHYQGGQRGSKMLRFLENKAQKDGIKTVFVLTTQSAHFFLEQGFVEAGVEDLPPNNQVLYNKQRNSKV